MSEYNRHKWAMEWMNGGGRDPNGRGLDEEIKLGKEDWMERQRVAAGGRIGLQSGQLVQPGPGRVGLQRGTLASAPWYRGTSGSSGVLKAPRGKTGMADILKHEGATIGALAINQLNKKKADESSKEITEGDDLPPVLPPDEPGPGTEIVEDVVTSELIEKEKKRQADEMATKASDEYRMKMRNIKKEKAIKENTITTSEIPQIDKRARYPLPYILKPEVFFPETITYNGETYDAEKFFRDNLIKRATHGTKRKTGKTALTNEALAKLYNTSEHQVERAVNVIRTSPEWDVKEPPLVDRSIYDVKVRERIANANKNLSPVELENVTIQDKWVWQANQDLGKQSLESIKKNKPQLIDEMQWKLVNGVIESVERSDEKLTEDLKRFFSVNHNVKRSTEQFNIQTLVNRGLTSKKINSLLNSIEAYIKNNPTHIRKIKNFEKFLSKRGLRVRVDGVSEELLNKLGKKTNFFGADPEGMFNSETGQSIQWETYLDFLDLVLDGPEGVPLIKMAEGGTVPRTGYKKAGLAGTAGLLGRSILGKAFSWVGADIGFYYLDKWNEMSKGKSEEEAAAMAKSNATLGLYKNKEYIKQLKKTAEEMGIDSRAFENVYKINEKMGKVQKEHERYQGMIEKLKGMEAGPERDARLEQITNAYNNWQESMDPEIDKWVQGVVDDISISKTGGIASPLELSKAAGSITEEEWQKPFIDIQDVALGKLEKEKAAAYDMQSKQVNPEAGNIGDWLETNIFTLDARGKAKEQERINDMLDFDPKELYRYNIARGLDPDNPLTWEAYDNLKSAHPGIGFQGAEGGIANLLKK